jgi:hypothetical protein
MTRSKHAPVCFLDLDGVLVDFVGGALAAHGRTLPIADVRWDFCTQIGFRGVDDPAFWAPLGYDFWANLGWHADGRAIVGTVDRLFEGQVALLTSPCDTLGCAEGKREWVRRHLPEFSQRLLIGTSKHLVAGPGKVLVDDHDANVAAFRCGGGRAVLVPRPWNTRCGETLDEGKFCSASLLVEIDAARSATLRP